MNLKTKTTILSLALTIGMCAVPIGAFAGVESDPNLAKLETKLFHNDFIKDDADTRLNRLEKMVFGEAKTGDEATRLKNLVSAVPNLDAPADNATAQNGSGDGAGNDSSVAQDGGSPRKPVADDRDSAIADREQQITGGSKYPAVTAMEKKLLGKDFAAEPIVKRLERLELKVNGKPVEIADLSERVDRLRSQTGIDVARTPPAGSDWADDEDQPLGRSEVTYVPERRPTTPTYDPSDDPMFNSRGGSQTSRPSSGWSGSGGDLTAGSGSYGTGARRSDGYTAGSGSYGSTPPAPRRVASALPPMTSSGIPQVAPDVVRGASSVPPTAMGLSQQVAMLEQELFRRTYATETIPNRLTRLESTIFPSNRPSEMSLPERVRRLTDAVPISPPGAQPNMPRMAQDNVPQVAPDYQDGGMPQVAPQRGPSGFSKIINGLGNLLMGAPMGAYPMNSNLVQDPTTGLLIDRMTGNMIDPTTGVVVRQGMGAPVGGAYNGFNNGLSPIGSPYGMGGNSMRFGFGGSGIRFGGGSSMGGMGMGSMGGMGMGTGIWP